MRFQDYYEILGVSKDATQDEIKKAFRRLSREFHPDMNKAKGAEDKFKQIGEAYEVLKDVDKRRKYDQMRAGGFSGGQDFRPPPGWQNVEWNVGGTPSGDVPSGFSEFFDAFFGGSTPFGGAAGNGGGRRGGRARRAPFSSAFDDGPPLERRGDQHEAEITVGLEDVLHGVTKSITLQQSVTGPDGGRRVEERTFQVKLPPGTTEGTKIRLAGQGGKGVGGGDAGDLLLKVRIAPHLRFDVDGYDLSAYLPISPWEAVFGAKVPFQTLDGEVQLKIPAGAAAGQKLRLKEKGLKRKDGTRGNLTLELRIAVPATLTDDEKRLFEELQKVSRFNPRA